MATRRGLLTLSDLVGIIYIDDVMNMPLLLESLPEINTLDLFYSTMLQAGIDQIQVPSNEAGHESVSPYLRRHLVFSSGREWVQASTVVREFFEHHLPSYSFDHVDNDDTDDEEDDIFTLYCFLVSLLSALSTGRNLINMNTFPEPEKLTGKLPPEVLLPVRGLLETFEAVNTSSVCPRIAVDRDNVALFQDLLVSQRYTKYKLAHSAFEDPSIPAYSSAEYVASAAKGLRSHATKWVRGKKIIVSVLPFSARIVDMIFGALPGKLAEQFARITQDWLTRNQRLVIYQMSGVKEEIFKSRINAYCKKKAADYAKAKRHSL